MIKAQTTVVSDSVVYLTIFLLFIYASQCYCLSLADCCSDVGAPHMQLMLVVWHSFSTETRGSLLTQCAHSVVSVAKAIEYVL